MGDSIHEASHKTQSMIMLLVLMMAFLLESNYHIDMSLNMEINSITSKVSVHISHIGSYSGVTFQNGDLLMQNITLDEYKRRLYLSLELNCHLNLNILHSLVSLLLSRTSLIFNIWCDSYTEHKQINNMFHIFNISSHANPQKKNYSWSFLKLNFSRKNIKNFKENESFTTLKLLGTEAAKLLEYIT